MSRVFNGVTEKKFRVLGRSKETFFVGARTMYNSAECNAAPISLAVVAATEGHVLGPT